MQACDTSNDDPPSDCERLVIASSRLLVTHESNIAWGSGGCSDTVLCLKNQNQTFSLSNTASQRHSELIASRNCSREIRSWRFSRKSHFDTSKGDNKYCKHASAVDWRLVGVWRHRRRTPASEGPSHNEKSVHATSRSPHLRMICTQVGRSSVYLVMC